MKYSNTLIIIIALGLRPADFHENYLFCIYVIYILIITKYVTRTMTKTVILNFGR